MSEPVPVVAAKEAQRKSAKRATLAKLKGKRPQQNEFETEIDGEQVSFLFRSIGAQDYDRLVTKYPPTTEQKAAGDSFDLNRFAPALLARVSIEPTMDEDEWSEIWGSSAWGRGEVSALFWGAVNLCNKGMDLNPTVAG
jgi:hypothetical protein